MNYLAHTVLSPKNIDFQLGNLLSDVLKGKSWEGCSIEHVKGLERHKLIDKFTDSHALVYEAKNILGGGRLSGVVLDIFFDHMLYKHWAIFMTENFDEFVQTFYSNALENTERLPEAGRDFIIKLVKYDFFHLYKNMQMLSAVFEKFDERLSLRLAQKETTSDYLSKLCENYFELETLSIEFFTDLLKKFA